LLCQEVTYYKNMRPLASEVFVCLYIAPVGICTIFPKLSVQQPAKKGSLEEGAKGFRKAARQPNAGEISTHTLIPNQ
jgi:hypothetical protein